MQHVEVDNQVNPDKVDKTGSAPEEPQSKRQKIDQREDNK